MGEKEQEDGDRVAAIEFTDKVQQFFDTQQELDRAELARANQTIGPRLFERIKRLWAR